MSNPAQVMWLMAGTALQRWLNRNATLMGERFRRKRTDAEAAAGAQGSAAQPKRRGAILMVVLGAAFFWNGTQLSSSFLAHVSDRLAASEQALIGAGTYATLAQASRLLSTIEHSGQAAEAREAAEEETQRVSTRVQAALINDLQVRDACEGNCVGRARVLLDRFRIQGMRAFHAEGLNSSFTTAVWPAKDNQTPWMRALGAALVITALIGICLAVCREELAARDWSLEWLFSFPVQARTLLLGRILESTLANSLTWLFYLPLFLTIYYCGGLGWAAVPVSVIAALYFALLVACVQVVMGTFLRIHLPPGRLRNVQAGLTVAASVLLSTLVITSMRQTFVPDVLLNAAEWVNWTPWSLPALLVDGNQHGWMPAIAAMACAILAPVLSVHLSQYIVRAGLVNNGAAHEGTRGSVTAPPATIADRWGDGVIARELRLLVRDRTLFAQTLILPVALLALQALLSPGLWHQLMAKPEHVAAAAFGMGSFVLMAAGMTVLASESKSLWLLYGLPTQPAEVFLRKTRLWGGIAMVYCVGLIVVYLARGASLDAIPAIVTAVLGVAIYASIACSLGVLGTRPTESGPQKVGLASVYLFMLLSGVYAYAIYNPSLWGKVAQIALSALLACALWERARARIPFLLDPTSSPAPAITLADGMVAALAFFVVQGATGMLLYVLGCTPSEAFCIGSLSAGALVAALSTHLFWRRGVAQIAAAVGLAPGRRTRHSLLPEALFWGLVGGMAASVVAVWYLHAVAHSPALHALREATQKMSIGRVQLDFGGWLAPLALLAAPLFEEYIFRGLIYRGMRRSLPVGAAIIGSSAVFAIVHPMASAVPMFIMSMIAAAAFERSRLLITPILVHLVYKGIVVYAHGLQTAWLPAF